MISAEIVNDESDRSRGSATRRFRTHHIIIALVALAVVAYLWSVGVAFQSGATYGDDNPRFATMTREETAGLDWPSDQTILVYRPVAFDPRRQTITIRLFLRPTGLSGGRTVGNNWTLSGSDVRLIFAGPLSVAGTQGRSDVVFEGDADSLPELATDFLLALPVDSLTDLELAALARTQEIDTRAGVQHAPFEIVLPAELYGRTFQFRDDAFWFPFDSYGFQLSVESKMRLHFDTETFAFLEEPSIWFPLALHAFPGKGNEASSRDIWSTSVEGWQVSYRHTSWLGSGFPHTAAEVNDGNEVGLIGVAFIVERPQSEILLTGLFALIYLVTMLALGIVAWSVRRGLRPPTGFGLVWAAALAFASVSLRSALPGEVPYGIAFDWLFFFPTLLGATIVTLMLAMDWVRRDDYTP